LGRIPIQPAHMPVPNGIHVILTAIVLVLFVLFLFLVFIFVFGIFCLVLVALVGGSLVLRHGLSLVAHRLLYLSLRRRLIWLFVVLRDCNREAQQAHNGG